MGNKSSDNAPDPRLVEAQIHSMGLQEKVANSLMENAKEFEPLQKEQMEFGLKSAKTAYDQSQADRSYALGKRDQLSGVQDSIVDDAKTFNTEDKRAELAGKAVADVNQAFDSAGGQAERAMERSGVNPNSGKAAAMGNQILVSKALAGAGAATKARADATTMGMALKDRAAGALGAYPGLSSGLTTAGAGLGASGVNVVNAGTAGINSGLTAAGGMAGSMGSNATGMFGQQANLASQENAAAGGAAAGLGSLIGTIGGMYFGPAGAALGGKLGAAATGGGK